MDPPDEVCTILRTPRPARRLGQSDRADDVDRRVELRVGDRAPHVDLGGQVEHHLGPVLGEDGDQVGVDDVGLDEDVRPGCRRRCSRFAARPVAEIVEADDACARRRAGGRPASSR